MPYIKQELRTPYNELIDFISKHIDEPLTNDETLGIWANNFKCAIMYSKPESFDGEFNYFLTKLFIKLNWVGDNLTYYAYMQSASKIEKLVHECLSIYEPSYYNYNRAIGMLNCCLLELRRRYGNKSIMATTFIQKVIKKYYEEIGAYEDTKITLNGDL
jgi:hypothetical protein